MERRTFNRLGFGLLAGLGVFSLVSFILGVFIGLFLFGTYFFSNDLDTITNALVDLTFFTSAAASGAFLLVFWLIVRNLPTERIVQSSLSVPQFLGFACVSIGAVQIFNQISVWLGQLLRFLNFTPLAEEAGMGMSEINPWVFYFSVCIVAPVCEELIFRKILLDRLRPFGDKIALLYSGFAFGLFHTNFGQFLFASVLGLILGYVVIKTGKIWYAIALHFIVNFFGSVVTQALPQWPVYGPPTLTILIWAFVLSAAVLFGFYCKRIILDPPGYRFSAPLYTDTILGNGGTLSFLIVSALLTLSTAFFIA
jgi:membrane protease YdiL (CAAX protease family)